MNIAKTIKDKDSDTSADYYEFRMFIYQNKPSHISIASKKQPSKENQEWIVVTTITKYFILKKYIFWLTR